MHDDHDVINDAFAAFRAGGPLASPIGADAARATVRHRRKVRTITVATVAALLIIAPVTAYATGVIDSHGPPVVGTSDGPSPSESASPTPPATSPATPPAPDGRVTVEQLARATVDFGSASAGPTLCPTGAFTFRGNPTNVGDSHNIAITKVIHIDFDHDGALETVALINCHVQGHDNVVLALDRGADGRISTVGKIVETSEDAKIRTVFEIRAEANGAVGVQVGDRGTCCGTTPEMVEHQWRSFSFADQRFRQSGGPTQFTPVAKSTDLSVTATRLALGAPAGGVRQGSITVDVHNLGPETAPGAIIEVSVTSEKGFPARIQLATDLNDCEIVDSLNGEGKVAGWRLRCHLFSFANGATRSFTFRITSPVANDDLIRTDATQQFPKLSVNAGVTAEQPNVRTLDDRVDDNNWVSGPITLAG